MTRGRWTYLCAALGAVLAALALWLPGMDAAAWLALASGALLGHAIARWLPDGREGQEDQAE